MYRFTPVRISFRDNSPAFFCQRVALYALGGYSVGFGRYQLPRCARIVRLTPVGRNSSRTTHVGADKARRFRWRPTPRRPSGTRRWEAGGDATRASGSREYLGGSWKVDRRPMTMMSSPLQWHSDYNYLTTTKNFKRRACTSAAARGGILSYPVLSLPSRSIPKRRRAISMRVPNMSGPKICQELQKRMLVVYKSQEQRR